MTPISKEQTTLIKFSPSLRTRRRGHNKGDGREMCLDPKYSLTLEPNNIQK